jgi:hypothetical protein
MLRMIVVFPPWFHTPPPEPELLSDKTYPPRMVTPSSVSESHPDSTGAASRRLVSDGEVLRAYERGELGAEIPLAAATDDSDSVSRGRAHCALFAIAAAHALGMKPRKILRGISRFEARAARSARRRSKKAARAKASVQTPALEEVSG